MQLNRSALQEMINSGMESFYLEGFAASPWEMKSLSLRFDEGNNLLLRCIRIHTVLCAQRSAVARIEHNTEALLQPFPSNALKRCYIHFLSSLNARISCVVACSWMIALCYWTLNTSLQQSLCTMMFEQSSALFLMGQLCNIHGLT